MQVAIPLYLRDSLSNTLNTSITKLKTLKSMLDLQILRSRKSNVKEQTIHISPKCRAIQSKDFEFKEYLSKISSNSYDEEVIPKSTSDIPKLNYHQISPDVAVLQIKLIKVDQDCKFLKGCCTKLQKELFVTGLYEDFKQKVRIEQELFRNFGNQKFLIATFADRVQRGEYEIEEFKYNTAIKIGQLNDVLVNLKNNCGEIRQQRKMENNLLQQELEQNIVGLQVQNSDTVRLLKSELEHYYKLLHIEKISHSSCCYEYRHNNTDLRFFSSIFLNHYHDNKNELQVKLTNLQKSFNVQHNRYMELQETFKVQLAVVEEKKKMEEEEIRKEEGLQVFIKAANMIQIWWRFNMVKFNLFPKKKKQKKREK